MKKRIILHIGQSKAGTTAIQRFLWSNQHALINKGICYLKTGVTFLDSPAQYSLFQYFSLPYFNAIKNGCDQSCKLNEVWVSAIDEIESSPCCLFIISCEKGWLISSEAIEYVKSQLKDYDVYIMIIFRDAKSYIVSSYKQHIKVGNFLGKFVDFFEAGKDRLNYLALVNRWSTVFGRQNLGVFSYEQINQDLIGNFLAILGIEIDQFVGNLSEKGFKVRANITPSEPILLVIRFIHLIENRLPKFARRPFKIFRRKLSRDDDWWLIIVLSKLPFRLINVRDLEIINTLPNNSGISFDTLSNFRDKVGLN